MKNYIEHNGKTIKTRVYYNLGGYNQKRGYYLSVQPIEISEGKTSNGQTYQIEKFAAYSGYYSLLFEVPRQSKKHEADAEKRANELIPEILTKFN
jgi:hypothetical protein